MAYSFADFIESDELNRLDRMVRDVGVYISTRIGSMLFDRSAGGIFHRLENSENTPVEDALIKNSIITLLADYNGGALPDLQVASTSDLIIIERDRNKVDVFVGILPLISPNLSDLRLFQLEIRV